jgi:hypothetical protein
MKGVSSHVKDLIKRILVPPAQRLTIDQILQHPWMTTEPSPIPLRLNVKNLNSFSSFSKVTLSLFRYF